MTTKSQGAITYQNLGARVAGSTVTVKLFLPDAGRDPTQYSGTRLPHIDEIRVAGTFQAVNGGAPWDVATAPVLERVDHPSGNFYVHEMNLPANWYEYKYVVSFEGGERRWITDPCTKYVGTTNANSGFVIGCDATEVRPLPTPRPLSEQILYEVSMDDFTAGYRGSEAPADAMLRRLDYIAGLGVTTIQFMPWAALQGSAFSWGYNPFLLFAVEDRLIRNPDRPLDRLHCFERLIDACHERDLGVFMDGVFNHVDAGTGPNTGFPYRWLYRDPEDSPYLGKFGDQLFFDDLDFSNGCTGQFVRDTCRYWLDRYRIDGIRFDYARGYIRRADVTVGLGKLIGDLRDELDSSGRPEVSLILEDFTDPRYDAIDTVNRFNADGCWLEPVMCELRAAAAGPGSPSPRLVRALDTAQSFAPPHAPVGYIDNHDYSSIATAVGGRERWWATQAPAIALFTTAGAVMIRNGQEYGQEIEMPGFDEPGRVVPRPLDLPLADDEIGARLRGLYRRLADIRKAHRALRVGDFRPRPYDERCRAFDADGYGVDTERALAVFARSCPRSDDEGGEEQIVVVLNFGADEQKQDVPFPCPGRWEELLDGAHIEVMGKMAPVLIPSHWGRIFVARHRPRRFRADGEYRDERDS